MTHSQRQQKEQRFLDHVKQYMAENFGRLPNTVQIDNMKCPYRRINTFRISGDGQPVISYKMAQWYYDIKFEPNYQVERTGQITSNLQPVSCYLSEVQMKDPIESMAQIS